MLSCLSRLKEQWGIAFYRNQASLRLELLTYLFPQLLLKYFKKSQAFIMYVQTSLAKKLQLKRGVQAIVVNAPPEFTRQLDVQVSTELAHKPDTSVDFVQFFVKTSQEVARLVPAATRVLKHDGLLWISYPKGTSKVKTDLNRDILWKALEIHGMAGVSMVSIDNVWSAMRFRPLEKVGK